MPDLLNDIECQARQRSAAERARLAGLRLDSLQAPARAQMDALWDEEIARRVAAFERGEITLYPAEQVFDQARQPRP